MKKISALMALLFITAPSAFADFGFEPYVGYGLLGSVNVTTSSTTAGGGNFSGLGIGGRATYGFMDMFWAGADVSYLPSMGYTASTGTSVNIGIDDGAKLFRLGAVAGIDLTGIPLRFWLGYNFLNNLSDTAGSTNITANGSSFKIGAGYKVIPLLSLNAEYIISSFGSTTTGTTTTNLPSGTSVSQNMLFLSASVPFHF